MELELRLPPDDASRLARLPLLATAGRLRGQAVRIIWHDSPNAALAADGLALAQERGTWRLERLIPGADAWPPGGPVPILAQAPSAEALDHALPAAMAAVAAFAGRRAGFELETEHGPLTLWAWRGALRGVASERPVCRLHLSGADAAVRSAALALAEALPVAVPRATLAAAGLSAARGTPLPARPHGAPVVPDGLDIGDSFACVLGHLTEVILHFAPAAADDSDGTEPVHQMRVAVRRLRSAIAMFRHALGCPELTAAGADLKGLGAQPGADARLGRVPERDGAGGGGSVSGRTAADPAAAGGRASAQGMPRRAARVSGRAGIPPAGHRAGLAGRRAVLASCRGRGRGDAPNGRFRRDAAGQAAPQAACGGRGNRGA